jgi:hypothetical protein
MGTSLFGYGSDTHSVMANSIMARGFQAAETEPVAKTSGPRSRWSAAAVASRRVYAADSNFRPQRQLRQRGDPQDKPNHRISGFNDPA